MDGSSGRWEVDRTLMTDWRRIQLTSPSNCLTTSPSIRQPPPPTRFLGIGSGNYVDFGVLTMRGMHVIKNSICCVLRDYNAQWQYRSCIGNISQCSVASMSQIATNVAVNRFRPNTTRRLCWQYMALTSWFCVLFVLFYFDFSTK